MFGIRKTITTERDQKTIKLSLGPFHFSLVLLPFKEKDIITQVVWTPKNTTEKVEIYYDGVKASETEKIIPNESYQAFTERSPKWLS